MKIVRLLQHEKKLKTRFSAGQTIFEEGQPADAMYVVLKGEVEICRLGGLSEPLSEGDIFGEMALIDESPRNIRVIAKTDCQVASVDKKQFKALVKDAPKFALQVMQVMAARLQRQHRR